MKIKILMFLFASLCIIATQVLAAPVYIENFSFEEPGEDKVKGWDMDDGAYFTDASGANLGPAEVPGWESEGTVSDSGVELEHSPTDGVWTAFMMGSDPSVWNLTDHTISSGEVFVLTFDAHVTWQATSIQADLFYDDGGTRIQVATETFAIGDEMVEYSLEFAANDVPASVGHRIGIEFDNPGGSDWLGFDNVRLDVTSTLISVVSPDIGDNNVGIDDDLYWDLLDPNMTDFNVYFYESADSEPNFLNDYRVVGTQLEVTDLGDNHFMAEPGTMSQDSDGVLYYWIVDALEPNDLPGGEPIVYPGATWYFWTASTVPKITVDPVSQTGDVVTLTVETEGLAPTAYDWYKVGEPDTLYQTTTAPLLTIDFSTATLDDEGYYYCVARNDDGSSEPSAAARVMKARLVGWWHLDQDLTDSVTEGPAHDGTATDPNWVIGGGINGSDAIEFFGDGRVVEIVDTGEYYNFYPQGMTVSAWVKSTTDGWDGVVAKHSRDLWLGWVVDVTDGWCHFTVRNSHDDLWGSNDTEDMFDGDWHLITAVMDPATQTSRIYVDGAERGESGTYDMASASLSTEPLVFGAETLLGQIPYVGQLDEVKVYNYPLDTMDIAAEYIQVTGEDVCINQDDPWRTFDYAGLPGEPSFCKVDIEDFALMITAWMECNIVPECIQ